MAFGHESSPPLASGAAARSADARSAEVPWSQKLALQEGVGRGAAHVMLSEDPRRLSLAALELPLQPLDLPMQSAPRGARVA
eukprot:CAMPEP_0118866760 /NCGR_PEP_ID=MMETSP1163-20130328/10562_1 /TAXON_ID=124430 /ORGANISM="Phaeomonas parva, Strain CCMP2877" /LENGTH=81 /DNA_ID=CAMNT_0006801103 /DNA_START=62 /DNA_END=303 /DNA_ORIENTATION=-